MATHSSILTWRIPWTKELGELQSTEVQRARHNWWTNTFNHNFKSDHKISQLSSLNTQVCWGLGLGQASGMEEWVGELHPGRSWSGKRLICLTICDSEGCWVSRSEVEVPDLQLSCLFLIRASMYLAKPKGQRISDTGSPSQPLDHRAPAGFRYILNVPTSSHC